MLFKVVRLQQPVVSAITENDERNKKEREREKTKKRTKERWDAEECQKSRRDVLKKSEHRTNLHTHGELSPKLFAPLFIPLKLFVYNLEILCGNRGPIGGSEREVYHTARVQASIACVCVCRHSTFFVYTHILREISTYRLFVFFFFHLIFSLSLSLLHTHSLSVLLLTCMAFRQERSKHG